MNLRSSIIFNQYVADDSPSNIAPDFVGNVPTSMPICETESVELLSPINPVTGHRDGDLSRLFNPLVSRSEKELIISNLQELKSRNSTKGLSDDDILMMIPSKYISDPVEINRYLEDIKEYRDALLSEKETKEEPEPLPDTSDTSTSPTPEPQV